jgi:hypothetical protein
MIPAFFDVFPAESPQSLLSRLRLMVVMDCRFFPCL